MKRPAGSLRSLPPQGGVSVASKRRASPEKHSSRGFSLLEVLVAFALLALVGTALHGVFSGALRNAAAAEDITRATLFAESRMAMLGYDSKLSPGTQTGEIEDTRYRWELVIRPYEPPQSGKTSLGTASEPQPLAGAKLLEAELTVSWPGPRDTRQSLSMTTLRLAPGE